MHDDLHFLVEYVKDGKWTLYGELSPQSRAQILSPKPRSGAAAEAHWRKDICLAPHPLLEEMAKLYPDDLCFIPAMFGLKLDRRNCPNAINIEPPLPNTDIIPTDERGKEWTGAHVPGVSPEVTALLGRLTSAGSSRVISALGLREMARKLPNADHLISGYGNHSDIRVIDQTAGHIQTMYPPDTKNLLVVPIEIMRDMTELGVDSNDYLNAIAGRLEGRQSHPVVEADIIAKLAATPDSPTDDDVYVSNVNAAIVRAALLLHHKDPRHAAYCRDSSDEPSGPHEDIDDLDLVFLHKEKRSFGTLAADWGVPSVSPTNQHMFMWLFERLCDIAQQREVNVATTPNIRLVVIMNLSEADEED